MSTTTESEERPLTCGDIVGVLAQPERRAAFAALALGATTLDDVAERAELRPTTAVGALQKLVDGRIAVVDRETNRYELVEDAFQKAVVLEVRISGRDGGDGAGVYFRRGRLKAIPGDDAVRARVLGVVAESFAPGEVYREPKVNALCGEWFDDWVSLRRALVDDGLLVRDETGANYERA